MSQNLIGVIKRYNGKYYVFPEEAEAVVTDTEKYIGPDNDLDLAKDKYWVKKPKDQWKRELEITSSSTLGPYDTYKEAVEKSQTDFFDGYFEYGVANIDYIDDIKLVLTYKGKEVEEDEPEEESSLERRVQNLESALLTQQAINAKIVTTLVNIIEALPEEPNLPSAPNGEEKKYKRTYAEYEKLVKKAFLEGNGLVEALEIAGETELIPEKKSSSKDRDEALKRVKDYYYKQKWNRRKGYVTVADWFCIQPMDPRDIDGEELTEEDTLLHELPLMTRRQAWKLINDNIADLGTYFRKV